MANDKLTAERLREVLHYDPDTGLFTWLVNRRSFLGKASKGSTAGANRGAGYLEIGIDGGKYLIHRLAWLYMTGRWPTIIDHIDRNRSNNAWSNLREVTTKQNQENRNARHDSSTGVRGITLLPSGKFRVTIKHNYKVIHVGCYDTIEQAAEDRKEAERIYFTHG